MLTELERRGIAVFSFARHRALLRGFDDMHLRKLVHQLGAKGWLQRIEAGKYVVVPRAARGTWHEDPLVIASTIAPEPHYISYWSALVFHDLTEQVPRSVSVALCERRKRPITFQGWRYQFVHRTTGTFYGFRLEDLRALNGAASVAVPVAEPEKAILDALDDELLAGGMAEIVKAVRRGLVGKVLDLPRLIDYARRYPNAAAVARLGYLLDRFGVGEARDLLPLVRRQGGVPLLATKTHRVTADTPMDRRWHLRINVSDALFATEVIA